MNAKALHLAQISFKSKGVYPQAEALATWSKCTQAEAVEVLKSFKGIKKEIDLHELPLAFLKVALAIIAILAIPRTFEFIRLWLFKFDESWISIITAVLFVGMLFFFPQIWMAQRKTAQGNLFLVFSIIAVLFSVLTTLDGLYTARTNSMLVENKENQGSKESGVLIPGLEKTEKLMLDNYESAKRETETKIKIRDNEVALSWKWSNLDWGVKSAKKGEELALSEWKKSLAELNQARNDNSKLELKREDFMSTSFVEWTMLVFFSLIIDLVGPMALAVSLFMRGKK